MNKIHYYRGTMTDGKRQSTNIYDLKPKGINKEFLKNPQHRPWWETPFNGILFVDPGNLIPKEIQRPQLPLTDRIDDYTMMLRDALMRYWLSVLREDEKYLCFHSAGYDSRIMSLSLMELRDGGYDHLTKNIHFRCHQPEEPMFLDIMQRQGWDKGQYSVYVGPEEDYYDIGLMDRPLNGWQHYNQQMNFWSDIPGAEDMILITGLGGEIFKFIAQGRKPVNTRVKNPDLNLLIDCYPHEGQWEGYWRSLFKDLYLPFWSLEYMSVSTRPNHGFCEMVGETDSVRAAVVESYIDTHGVDCRNIKYGVHDYSWNISEARKVNMNAAFKDSKFYNDFKDILPKDMDFFDMTPGSRERLYYGHLWGFMTCYERMYADN